MYFNDKVESAEVLIFHSLLKIVEFKTLQFVDHGHYDRWSPGRNCEWDVNFDSFYCISYLKSCFAYERCPTSSRQTSLEGKLLHLQMGMQALK